MHQMKERKCNQPLLITKIICRTAVRHTMPSISPEVTHAFSSSKNDLRNQQTSEITPHPYTYKKISIGKVYPQSMETQHIGDARTLGQPHRIAGGIALSQPAPTRQTVCGVIQVLWSPVDLKWIWLHQILSYKIWSYTDRFWFYLSVIVFMPCLFPLVITKGHNLFFVLFCFSGAHI